MLIRAAFIDISIFHYISADIANNCTNKVSIPMFSGAKTIPELTTCVLGTLRKFKSASITENGTFVVSQPILHLSDLTNPL